ncbi:MAG TPA: hypothetical protein DIT34_02905, partial [Acinetobacter ursingii]|nr:hypothetical protein [Acinetobacter ursingii]
MILKLLNNHPNSTFFLISVILNHYYILNLVTILISVFIVATPFYVFINFLHAASIPDPWWKMYSHFSTI